MEIIYEDGEEGEEVLVEQPNGDLHLYKFENNDWIFVEVAQSEGTMMMN